MPTCKKGETRQSNDHQEITVGPGGSLDIGEEPENFFPKNDLAASLVQA